MAKKHLNDLKFGDIFRISSINCHWLYCKVTIISDFEINYKIFGHDVPDDYYLLSMLDEGFILEKLDIDEIQFRLTYDDYT